MLQLPGEDLFLFTELVASLVEAKTNDTSVEVVLWLPVCCEELKLICLSLVKVGDGFICDFGAKSSLC